MHRKHCANKKTKAKKMRLSLFQYFSGIRSQEGQLQIDDLLTKRSIGSLTPESHTLKILLALLKQLAG